MSKHVWRRGRTMKPGRTCLRCGVRRRIKPGTRSVWQYRWQKDETWLASQRCGVF